MITSKLRVFALQRKSERKLGEKIARKKKPRQCYLEYESLTSLRNMTCISSYDKKAIYVNRK